MLLHNFKVSIVTEVREEALADFNFVACVGKYRDSKRGKEELQFSDARSRRRPNRMSTVTDNHHANMYILHPFDIIPLHSLRVGIQS